VLTNTKHAETSKVRSKDIGVLTVIPRLQTSAFGVIPSSFHTSGARIARPFRIKVSACQVFSILQNVMASGHT
jgi:hypothetical protein